MGYGYSLDLRERVVAYYDAGGVTEAGTADAFALGEATVRRWRRFKRENGSVAPLAPGGGYPPRVQGAGEEVLRRIVEETPDATIEELTATFAHETGGPISPSSISRALARLGITRKKKSASN